MQTSICIGQGADFVATITCWLPCARRTAAGPTSTTKSPTTRPASGIQMISRPGRRADHRPDRWRVLGRLGNAVRQDVVAGHRFGDHRGRGATAGKYIFTRVRPSTENNPCLWFKGGSNHSFPSGEAAVSAALVTPYVIEYGGDNPRPMPCYCSALCRRGARSRIRRTGRPTWWQVGRWWLVRLVRPRPRRAGDDRVAASRIRRRVQANILTPARRAIWPPETAAAAAGQPTTAGRVRVPPSARHRFSEFRCMRRARA